jgi:hypothetical protein
MGGRTPINRLDLDGRIDWKAWARRWVGKMTFVRFLRFMANGLFPYYQASGAWLSQRVEDVFTAVKYRTQLISEFGSAAYHSSAHEPLRMRYLRFQISRFILRSLVRSEDKRSFDYWFDQCGVRTLYYGRC